MTLHAVPRRQNGLSSREIGFFLAKSAWYWPRSCFHGEA
jgi:hypothetical protein